MGCGQSKSVEVVEEKEDEEVIVAEKTIIKKEEKTNVIEEKVQEVITSNEEDKTILSSKTNNVAKADSESDGSSSDASDSDESDDEVLGDWFEQDDFVAFEPTTSPKNEEVPKTPVESCEFFLKFPETYRNKLVGVMDEITFHDGDEIIKQGESSNRMYVITEGEAVVTKKATKEGETDIEITHLYAGGYFGEMSLLFDGKTSASILSVGDCTCMSLGREVFKTQPEVRLFLLTKKILILSQLPIEDRDEIVQSLEPRNYEDGDFVIRQGDSVEQDAYFIIVSGIAKITENQPDGSMKHLTKIYQGACVGEAALLDRTEKRNANIIAKGKLKCMCLTLNGFNNLSSTKFKEILIEQNEKKRKIRIQRKQSIHQNNAKLIHRVSSRRRTSGIGSMSRSGNKLDSTAEDLNDNNGEKDDIFSDIFAAKSAATKITTTAKRKKSEDGTKMVNNYKCGKHLGSGAFSDVKLAIDTNTSQKYAMKIMDKKKLEKKMGKIGGQSSLMEDIEREIEVMKLLAHENIVALQEVINDPADHYIYIIQEYCSGGEIQNEGEPLNEEKARKYFRSCLRAVEYMHSQHVIHRDIKPENILLDKNDNVKLADFGTAQIVKEGEKLSIPKGTPAFMAPELLSFDTVIYSGPPADIWSLGATLFMLVVGHPPWMAANEIELGRKVKNDELRFPEDCNNVGPHLRHFIKSMLNKDPSKRPTLETVMRHEWVTNEGAMPLPLTIYDDYEDSDDEEDEEEDVFDVDVFDDDSLGLSQGSLIPAKSSNRQLKPLSKRTNISADDDEDLKPCSIMGSEYNVFNLAKRNAYAGQDDDCKKLNICVTHDAKIGGRNNMEDMVAVTHLNFSNEANDSTFVPSTAMLFAVFDGHGGNGASSQLKANMGKFLEKQANYLEDPEKAIVQAAHEVDWKILKDAANVIFEMKKKVSDGSFKKRLTRTSRKAPNEDNHMSGSTGAYAIICQKKHEEEEETAAAAIETDEETKVLPTTGPSGLKRQSVDKARSCKVVSSRRQMFEGNIDEKNENSVPEKVEIAHTWAHIAWVGDSRVVLSTDNGKAVALSEDHKASREDEKARLRAAGGTVNSKDRLYGDLAVSRAFGDISHKGHVKTSQDLVEKIVGSKKPDLNLITSGALIATPNVVLRKIERKDEFIIIASDGLWDVVSNQQAVNYIRNQIAGGIPIGTISKNIVHKAIALGSVDNVSAVVVCFNQRSEQAPRAHEKIIKESKKVPEQTKTQDKEEVEGSKKLPPPAPEEAKLQAKTSSTKLPPPAPEEASAKKMPLPAPEQAKKKVEHQEAEGSIIVTVDAHAAETKSVTKKSLADDRSRTGFAIGDRVNVLGTMDDKLYPATVYNVGESKVELRWDDGDVSNRFHAFDVPKLITTNK